MAFSLRQLVCRPRYCAGMMQCCNKTLVSSTTFISRLLAPTFLSKKGPYWVKVVNLVVEAVVVFPNPVIASLGVEIAWTLVLDAPLMQCNGMMVVNHTVIICMNEKHRTKHHRVRSLLEP